MRAIWSGLVGLLSFLWYGLTFPPESSWKTVRETNQRAIVFLSVTTSHENGVIEEITGTGFLIDPEGWILTCAHVVPSFSVNSARPKYLASVGGRNEHQYPFTVVRRDPELDLALLKLERRTEPWPTVKVDLDARLDFAQAIYTMGYPRGGALDGVGGTLRSQEGALWITDAPIDKGSSGGPVFSEAGAVVAVAVGAESGGNQRNLIVPVRFAAEWLREFLRTPAPEPSPEPPPVDCSDLRQETSDLKQRAEKLQNENRDSSSKIGRLEKLLNIAQKELTATQKEVERLRRLMREPVKQPPKMPEPAKPDELVLGAVKEALGKIDVSVTGPVPTEIGAFQAWKALHAQYGVQAIRSLLSLLNTKLELQDQWKIITLLNFATHTSEGDAQTDAIFAAMADLVLRSDYVGKAALDLIASAPVAPRTKWETLFPILEQAPPDKVDVLIQRVPAFTPDEERGRTAKFMADILAYSDQQYSTIPAAIYALETLNARSEIPRFREILAKAPVQKANSLASLLAYFGDRDSVPHIHKAIETWRYGSMSIQSLLSSLQTLEGSACYPYFSKIIADSHPAIQREILHVVQYSNSGDPVLIDAIRRLAESTTNQDLKKLAEQYLSRVAPPATVPPP